MSFIGGVARVKTEQHDETQLDGPINEGIEAKSMQDHDAMPHVFTEGTLIPVKQRDLLTFSYLEKMRKIRDPDLWQSFCERILPLLDDLESACRSIASSRNLQPALKTAASHWVHRICDLRHRAKRSHQTVIGVLGNTGDGKSSTINALLDEESLLPTSCMRACTAVATEISYNHDEDEQNPYRAEIDFISREEWVREVNILLMEFLADETEEKEDLDPESEAAKALAKVQAVYPSMTIQDLATSTSAQLADHPNITRLLGTTMTLKCDNAQNIREEVQPYVDSKDKDDDTAAYWPLVKVVRIFTKAKVLSNGITIVDLPGHQDWDAARAAVASNYIKSCSGIWVVAPINRAVDNKTAKDIMSNSIKRQLKLDGAFSALTIICSKTDDMAINSGLESMKSRLNKDTKDAWIQVQAIDRRIKALEKDLKVVRGCRKQARTATDDATERLAKRARTEPPDNQAKDLALETSMDLADDSATNSDPNAKKHEELAELKLEKKQLMYQVHARLIRRRNELSREAVKKHLAKSFRDLDRQDAANSDAHSQAIGEPRDYDEMSILTPVFCTSSHVYQKMQGLVANDDETTPGFDTEEDTEIPQLQAHAQKLTEELRIAKYQEVLNDICQVLNSIAIWARDTAETRATIDGEHLKGMLIRLQTDINGDVEDCLDNLHLKAETILYAQMTRLSSNASRAAVPTALRWCHMNHSTLRATFIRQGTWKLHNFNEDLVKPIKENIAQTWANFFQFSIPSVLDNFSVSTTQRLSTFHEQVIKQLGVHDNDHDESPTIMQLNQQLKLHKEKLVRIAAQSRNGVDEAQKDASRALTPPIAEEMAPGYEECGQIHGTGSVKKMHARIQEYILNRKIKMFRTAIRNVKEVLEDGLETVGEDMTAEIRNLAATMHGDYMLALAEKRESARRIEEASKRGMMEFLEHAGEQFR
ncbi:hypothetical protein CORC01_10507 [Colletotrichum orchidophilum]|uniref:Tat pathway signal sequence n=1 Tax=Colletotrichum orchidophilum TaxID=1209926 RepID=A0A1G4AYC5_9PEZI|nr:uncharacterized protein CORC01_10507 [Colletotrichum orchidophilum]OHE94169.1 hypothetical protein CORC01_10507 [Colletotrichum orchidophilum]